MSDSSIRAEFEAFVERSEARLRISLTAVFGQEGGRDAAAAALVIHGDGRVWRSADGSSWEVSAEALTDPIGVPGGGWWNGPSLYQDALITSGVGEMEDRPYACREYPDVGRQYLRLATSGDGELWTVRSFDPGLPVGPAFGCVGLSKRLAVGSAGYLMTGSAIYELEAAGIAAEQLGSDADPRIVQVREVDTVIVAETVTGEVHELDLVALGYVTEEVGILNILRGGQNAIVVTERAFAWWSADGSEWKPAVMEGPMLNAQIESVEAVEDGFIVESTGPKIDDRGEGIKWFTRDGSAWTIQTASSGQSP